MAQVEGRTGIMAGLLSVRMKRYILPSLLLAYMVLSFSLPTVRDFSDWQLGESADTIFVVFEMHFGLTLYALIVAMVVILVPKARVWLDKMLNKSVVVALGSFFLISCLVLTICHVYGWWWTWLTAGVQMVTLLLVYLILEKRIGGAGAFIVGVALVGLAVGVWEIPYQVGLKLHYDMGFLPTDLLWKNIIREIMIEVALIFPAIIILLLYQREYKLINYNWWTVVFVGATVVLFVCWILSGFWVEMTYNWANHQWVQHPVDWVAKTVYRASKVTLGLAMVSLVWRKQLLTK